MAAMQQSRPLFSLKHILGQQGKHVHDDVEAQGYEIAMEVSALVAERTARQRAVAQARMQADMRARDEAIRLAEIARFEAMRLAAVERARSEAQMQARIEALTLELEHERAMRILQTDVRPRPWHKVVLLAALAASFIFGMGLGAYLSSVL